jgi:hypothetical protein
MKTKFDIHFYSIVGQMRENRQINGRDMNAYIKDNRISIDVWNCSKITEVSGLKCYYFIKLYQAFQNKKQSSKMSKLCYQLAFGKRKIWLFPLSM